MSWHFSRALVAASSVDTSSGGDASAPSSTTTMPEAFWSHGRTTAACRRSRSGMTFAPLTDDRGAALLTWCLADSRARTSAPPARAPASADHDPASGPRWRALSVRFSPDTSGWRTARSLYAEDLAWSSLTLPRWGSLHGGELWERTTQEPRTSETGSGCWPTPMAQDAKHSGYAKSGPGKQDKLPYAVVRATWPTPTASMMPCEGTQRLLRKKWLAGELSLEEASAIAGRDVREAQGKIPKWPTPTVDDANNVTRKSGEFKSLTRAVMWPTPRAANPGSRPNGNGGKILAEEVAIVEGLRERGQKMFPTPCASEARQGYQNRHNGKKGSQESLTTVVQGGPADQAGGALNPTWVEWLMGWPLGWTDCGASATDRFREWCSAHGRS